MPCHKVGRLWKFRKEEIDDWVRSGQAETSSETNSRSNKINKVSGSA